MKDFTREPSIEVYEWKEGTARVGSKTKSGCIDILAIPHGGQVPQQGDILMLNSETPGEYPKPYRVLSRELMWFRAPNDDDQTPAKWSKMWIHVRRLSEEEYAQEDQWLSRPVA